MVMSINRRFLFVCKFLKYCRHSENPAGWLSCTIYRLIVQMGMEWDFLPICKTSYEGMMTRNELSVLSSGRLVKHSENVRQCHKAHQSTLLIRYPHSVNVILQSEGHHCSQSCAQPAGHWWFHLPHVGLWTHSCPSSKVLGNPYLLGPLQH